MCTLFTRYFNRHLHRVLPWNHQSTIQRQGTLPEHVGPGAWQPTYSLSPKDPLILGGSNLEGWTPNTPTKAGSHLKMSTNTIHQFPINFLSKSLSVFMMKNPLKVVHARKETNHVPTINFQVLLLMEEILHQLIRTFSPIIYSVLYNPGGFLAGFLNHQPTYVKFRRGNIYEHDTSSGQTSVSYTPGKLTSLEPTKITGMSQEDSKWLVSKWVITTNNTPFIARLYPIY